MRIFEYPYVIISVFAICFLLLLAVGIYFAVRGMKTANSKDENDFLNISRLEKDFVRAGKLRKDRCIIYISVSLDNFRSLYSRRFLRNISARISGICTTLRPASDLGSLAYVFPPAATLVSNI